MRHDHFVAYTQERTAGRREQEQHHDLAWSMVRRFFWFKSCRLTHAHRYLRRATTRDVVTPPSHSHTAVPHCTTAVSTYTRRAWYLSPLRLSLRVCGHARCSGASIRPLTLFMLQRKGFDLNGTPSFSPLISYFTYVSVGVDSPSPTTQQHQRWGIVASSPPQSRPKSRLSVYVFPHRPPYAPRPCVGPTRIRRLCESRWK